jgi:hypothetical protein
LFSFVVKKQIKPAELREAAATAAQAALRRP